VRDDGLLVPGLVAVFGALTRLLPREAREGWGREARRDLARLLRETRRHRGGPATLAGGLRAMVDLAGRVPAEWWRARRVARASRGTVNASGDRPGMGERWMDWIREMRIAARALTRRPGYATAAALTLALGIGGSVAIFTVVNAVLLEPLPYDEADGIVSIRHHAPGLDLMELNNSDGTLSFYRAEADFLEAVGAYGVARRNLVGGARPERVEAGLLSPEMFEILRVQPRLGRAFADEDALEGAAPVALLTHGSWVERFGADPGVLGRTVEVDGVITEIVGVMPEGFAFPDPEVRLFQPTRVDPDGAFGQFGTGGLARLAPGVTVEEAARRAEALQARLPDFFPNLDAEFLERAGWSVTLERYQDELVGDEVASTLWIVLATVGVVLLIACANVANLFLVRAESREKELAVRAAMGAGGGRITRSFLAESLLLGVAGGAVGGGLAWVGVDLLVRHGPQGLPRLHEVALGPAELGLAALLALSTGLVLSLLPALRYRTTALARVLRDGGRASTDGPARNRSRNVLVAGQLALALVLLVGSGLMLRSFQAMRGVELGFDPEGVTVVGLSLGEGVENREGASFYRRVADQVAALPGVASVGLSTMVPLAGGGSNGGSFYIESVPRAEDELPPVAMYKAVGADYLGTMGQALVAGRALTRADWEDGTPVALVNETFARRFLDGNALGEGIKWDEDAEFARVVGVVEDARELDLTEDPGAWAYLPMVVGDWGYPDMDQSLLTVRMASGGTLPVQAVQEIVARLDPTVPLTSVRTMEEVVAQETAGTSFTMVLLLLAALTALFLGAIGLFGVISYVVGQRTREIGIRVALGAEAAEIRRMVLRQGAGVVLAGVLLGLAASFGLSRLMASILFGVSTNDPLSFATAPVILVGVALLATWLPARRASRVDPVEALRAE